MELTMLRQSAHRGHLEALLNGSSLKSTVSAESAKILKPDNSSSTSTHIMNGIEIVKVHASGKALDLQHYAMLLRYLNAIGKNYCSAYTVSPQVLGTLILPPSAQQPHQLKFEKQ
jgi:hypothetical protein